MTILVLNAGSSTVKWSSFRAADRFLLATGTQEWEGDDDASSGSRVRQLQRILTGLPQPSAVGHRFVHGGHRLRQSARLGPEQVLELQQALPLDPLHMRPALMSVEVVTKCYPNAVQIAAFDTGFHATMSEAASGYGLPQEWSQRWNLRRYGFHGLSVCYSVRRCTDLLGSLPPRLLVCHLGSGSSVTAVLHGQSVDTSMGFTPLDGVMMATRCGAIDPGIILHLQTECGLHPESIRRELTVGSGLLGVSGLSGDLRLVLQAANQGHTLAQLAYDRLMLSLKRSVGAMAAILGGIDALVFTGGIGENAIQVRHDLLRSLIFLGIELDPMRNSQLCGEGTISAAGSAATVLVIPAREDLVVLDEVCAFMQPSM